MIGSVEKVSWIIGVPWQIHQTEQPIKKALIHLATQNSYVVSNQLATQKNQHQNNQHQPFGNGNGLNAGGKFGSNGISG